ncbi:LON peptidase substrate-binding domain-containing protein [Kaistia dalseonensis]|uniref:Lon protease-like protein n=1 Tax=Kaistia dalseonensis TaxID=410840 RepID=A0ABU0H730_9HYPH|nr:LON peptidase substrate-binding domain-containing protein [Kaistia dalseonensis]MCX5494728.1 LON peptidase substrate-binding domain-containing protein [Kaistia dalseonensis]MDQ0437309.1 Lon protease-like protein [Kaistia dalseonensis]
MQAGNATYDGPDDVIDIVPVFPLSAALLLPRGQMPLNIFEPRYVAMVDAAMAGGRLIGMIQPASGASDEEENPALAPIGCVGRITSYAESGDNRYMICLTGIARFRVIEEIESDAPFRQCRITTTPFQSDFVENVGAETVDRPHLLEVFRAYLEANRLEADWDNIDRTSNETLVNALSMMSPYGAAEKQALLEAPDLRTRAETLIALTEIALARRGDGGPPSHLQ